MGILLGKLIAELSQRRNIIKDPERPSMRGEHEIVIFDHQVMDWCGRKIELQ